GLLDGLAGGSEASGEERTVQAGDVLPGRYIVRLAPDLPELLGVSDLRAGVETILVAVGGGQLRHLYQSALTGAAVELSETQAALLESMPGVLAVEHRTQGVG
ncbi:MAG: subtilisin, partial [Anaerolineae bacterium]|nr:subtilisin [Anaerolineae bacterium]